MYVCVCILGPKQSSMVLMNYLYTSISNVLQYSSVLAECGIFLFSEELSHMLYAAADMVLVPSMYEPCGLAQMIGMRYGVVLLKLNPVTYRF